VRGSWSEKVQEGERLQKEDRTPVTVADFAVQAVVALQLRVGALPSLVAW
jgi:3'-phosphoadenosine 5'-phosphosulfate (PAPS) 3'-phosphatase